ncbi:MAG: sodium-dependent transporter [Acutalibacteraceae bacterium]|nr:sodium-dependent transporter [Acutalibacteraceae bacterium]
MARDSFKSRLGFILVSAGCAIGIGNVWRFPYVTGQNGGGIFVIFYLLFLLTMGIPVLTMELAVGRASKKSALQAFKTLEKPKQKWHIHGWLCMIGCYILMMYYTTVSGWMTNYFVKFASGTFKSGMTTEQVNSVFANMTANPLEMVLWMAITVIAGFVVCSFGLQKGVERISKWMMLALLVLMVVLAINSATLDGGLEGIKYYLIPSVSRLQENNVNIFDVIVAAMNQSFFTLSLGIGSMQIFGSYMSKDNTLAGESARICVLDTFVALMSGMIIFPACFAYNVDVNAGPPLIFQTLPNVFLNMPMGRVWGALFFVFMTFASFSTVLAVFENLQANLMDNLGWSRKKASVVNGIAMLVLSTPCALGFNLLSGINLGGKNILDMEDFVVSQLLLPIGSLVFLLFCVTKWGWGFDKYIEEANTGKGTKLPHWLKYYFRFIVPVLIVVIFVAGLVSFFKG